VLEQVKKLESIGYSFEGAEASVELMLRRAMKGYRPPWELIDFTVLTGNKRVQLSSDPSAPSKNESVTQAMVKLGLLGPLDGSNMAMCPTKVVLECGEGNGPYVSRPSMFGLPANHAACDQSLIMFISFHLQLPTTESMRSVRLSIAFSSHPILRLLPSNSSITKFVYSIQARQLVLRRVLWSSFGTRALASRGQLSALILI
jgi:hypothetical protein